MNKASLKPLLLSVSFVALTASQAVADSRVFLLQLGSFESKTEAQTRWLRLSDKYPDLLQGLNMRTIDVTLPPDNFTVYRTQAGALESRSDAQIICDRLSSAGDECYVVETAMFKAPQPAQPRIAAPVSAPAIAPVQSAPEIAFVADAEPVVTIEPSPLSNALQDFTDAGEQSTNTAFTEIEDALLQAEANIPQSPTSLDVAAPTLAFEDSQAALDAQESSFWDWINPFSSSTASAPATTATATATAVSAPSIAATAASAPQPVALPAPPPAQASASLSAPAPTIAPQALAVEPAENFIPNSSNVQVAEAIRVPVTQIQRVSPDPASTAQLRALGLPSQPLPDRNLWAEINYFATQQDALGFWDEFRWANPGFPPVRIRVTNPYLRTSSPRVSLRVGPFANQARIADICAEVVENSDRSCQLSREIGGSSAARFGARTRSTPNNRYRAVNNRTRARTPMYWVQLGAFTDTGAAHHAWRALQQRHAPTLNDMKADIATAGQSSALASNYRLRTGPFPMRAQASALCSQLQSKGSQCATIFSR